MAINYQSFNVFLRDPYPANTTVEALYDTLNPKSARLSQQASIDAHLHDGQCRIDWTKPSTSKLPLQGTLSLRNARATEDDAKDAVKQAVNSVLSADGIMIKNVQAVGVKMELLAPDADTFGVSVQNQKEDLPMYPLLFQTFDTDASKDFTKLVAWRMGKTKIDGDTAWASTQWDIQYAVVWGTLAKANTTFAMSAHKTMDLGQTANLTCTDDYVTCQIVDGGKDGAISIHIDKDWNPSETHFCGFGVVVQNQAYVLGPIHTVGAKTNGKGPQAESVRTVGITKATSSMNNYFTPKLVYYTALKPDDQNQKLYTLQQMSDFGEVDFTGKKKDSRFAWAILPEVGGWEVTYHDSPPSSQEQPKTQDISTTTATVPISARVPIGKFKAINISVQYE